MKKALILFISALLVAGHVQAQTTKGTLSLSGVLGYSGSTGSADKEEKGVLFDSRNRDYSTGLAAGFFIQDNLELGAAVSRFTSENKSLTPYPNHIEDQKTVRQEKDIRVFARKYTFLTDKLAAYATLSGGWNSSDLNVVSSSAYLSGWDFTTSYVSTNHYTTWAAALSPGLSYFASDKIAISLNLGALSYSRYKVAEKFKNTDTRFPENTYETKYNAHILELDFSSMNLNLGLSYFFRK